MKSFKQLEFKPPLQFCPLKSQKNISEEFSIFQYPGSNTIIEPPGQVACKGHELQTLSVGLRENLLFIHK